MRIGGSWLRWLAVAPVAAGSIACEQPLEEVGEVISSPIEPEAEWLDDVQISAEMSDEEAPVGAGEPNCLAELVESFGIWPGYDLSEAVFGSHCYGTDHQDIEAVDRVVFLGDSITVGTPPTLPQNRYRSMLADTLAKRFGLKFSWWNKLLWRIANPVSGQATAPFSGDFASCAKWGARNVHLTQPNGAHPSQLLDCFPASKRGQTTLVIITSGGNDMAALARAASAGAPLEELWQRAEDMVAHKQAALEWLTEPGRFPNGIYVVFANVYEFTDGTGALQACDMAGLAGFEDPLPVPQDLLGILKWVQARYLELAVWTQTDMIFMFEHFCGHGFENENPEAACHLGAGGDRWFDLTCIHPNRAGHEVITDMFLDVIDE